MYLLYTDSAADMPHDAFERYDIRVVPMDYTIDGQEYSFHTERADHDEVCAALFEAQRNGADVHTSQIAPYGFVEAWKEDLEAGNDILYLAFSSGMSATYDNACQAVAQLKEKYPERTIEAVDTLSATAGQGILVMAAAMNREKGMTLQENAEWLRGHAKFVCHRFVAGDLDYLHKGGRVSGAVAVIGGALNIKPLLIIDDDGSLSVVGKAHGMRQAMKSLVRGYDHQQGVEGVPPLVFLSHSADKEGSEKLKQMVEAVVPPGTRVETVCLSPIIGAHTGTEHLSVCGWGMSRREEK